MLGGRGLNHWTVIVAFRSFFDEGFIRYYS